MPEPGIEGLKAQSAAAGLPSRRALSHRCDNTNEIALRTNTAGQEARTKTLQGSPVRDLRNSLLHTHTAFACTMQCLVLSSASYVSGSFLSTLLVEQDLDLKVTTLLNNSATLQPKAAPQQAFDKALSIAQSSGHHTAAYLALVGATLKPGASLTVYEPAPTSSEQTASFLKKALLLAGFVDSTDSQTTNSSEGQLIYVSRVSSICDAAKL